MLQPRGERRGGGVYLQLRYNRVCGPGPVVTAFDAIKRLVQIYYREKGR